jgi:DNA-directed RNA polymerase specialized sigma24 family protein
MNRDRILIEADFNLLLAWLDPDRDAAGEKYEAIRRSLVKFFACRGCYEAEDLAVETIWRVASKAQKLRETYVGDPALYFYGVGQNVYHEWLRESRRGHPDPPPPPPERDDLALDCLDECLAGLPADSRELVVEYYRGEGRAKIKNREKRARTLGITLNALRIRACHIRASLRRCVAECVRQGAAG